MRFSLIFFSVACRAVCQSVREAIANRFGKRLPIGSGSGPEGDPPAAVGKIGDSPAKCKGRRAERPTPRHKKTGATIHRGRSHPGNNKIHYIKSFLVRYVRRGLKCGQSLSQLSSVQRLVVQCGHVPIVGSPRMLSSRCTSVTGVLFAQSPQRCSVVVVVFAIRYSSVVVSPCACIWRTRTLARQCCQRVLSEPPWRSTTSRRL